MAQKRTFTKKTKKPVKKTTATKKEAPAKKKSTFTRSKDLAEITPSQTTSIPVQNVVEPTQKPEEAKTEPVVITPVVPAASEPTIDQTIQPAPNVSEATVSPSVVQLETDKPQVANPTQVAPISEVTTESPGEIPPSGGNKDRLIIMVLIIILISSILIFTGIFIYNSGVYKNILPKESVAPTLAPVSEKVAPTSTPTPKAVDVSKYKVKILNGSGIIGEAGKLQQVLESEKFTVSEVGNAQGYDYEETIVQVKKTIDKSYLEKLKKTISKSKKLGKDDLLSESVIEDVVVIVGSLASSGSAEIEP